MLHPRTVDITGETFGKLTVVKFHKYIGVPKRAMWLCECECGNEKIAGGNELQRGGVKSCGCIKKAGVYKTHGDASHNMSAKEYRAWSSMRARCTNPRNSRYHLYGGRGIEVCQQWDKYETFLSDVVRAPSIYHSIDRIDVNGNYEPSNVQWSTPQHQAMNKRCGLPSHVGVWNGVLSFGC